MRTLALKPSRSLRFAAISAVTFALFCVTGFAPNDPPDQAESLQSPALFPSNPADPTIGRGATAPGARRPQREPAATAWESAGESE